MAAGYAKVRLKYSSSGGTPSALTSISVQCSSKNPTESEISAIIKKKNPKWNFIILKIE
jgi:hypothetical protein